jgi:hypothetical protein
MGNNVPRYEAELKRALGRYVINLEEVQKVARRLKRQLRGRYPVAPDLWLFTGNGHRFIEVKLPKDRVRDTQLAGLAVVAALVRAGHPVSVEVVELTLTGESQLVKKEAMATYKKFYRRLAQRR